MRTIEKNLNRRFDTTNARNSDTRYETSHQFI